MWPMFQSVELEISFKVTHLEVQQEVVVRWRGRHWRPQHVHGQLSAHAEAHLAGVAPRLVEQRAALHGVEQPPAGREHGHVRRAQRARPRRRRAQRHGAARQPHHGRRGTHRAHCWPRRPAISGISASGVGGDDRVCDSL